MAKQRNAISADEAKAILALPMRQPNDARAKTVGHYLQLLLLTVLYEEESFSGKRPFGNSGWKHNLYFPLVKAGKVKGEIEDGCLEDYDGPRAEALILQAAVQLTSLGD